MKPLLGVSLVFVTSVFLAVSTASAGWGWDRDAGAKARGDYDYGRSSSYRQSEMPRYEYLGSSAQPMESQRMYSYEPTVSFKAGDMIVVAASEGQLKIGDRVVATVPCGQHLTVLSVQGPWVGTAFDVGGKQTTGWILSGQVTLATAPSKPH